ncbi:MAG: hypothetical protein FJW68_04310 [Actinobacteria bacterium]|nr:hypothetical protein [Actinomycetota bacterium]
MPEESINIFISNIYSTAAFTAVFALLFLFVFALSKVLMRKTGEKIKNKEGQPSHKVFNHYEINKDTGYLKTVFVAGSVFILAVLFIFLIILTVYFANNFIIGGSLYLIFITVFLILAITVYLIKSRIISR